MFPPEAINTALIQEIFLGTFLFLALEDLLEEKLELEELNLQL